MGVLTEINGLLNKAIEEYKAGDDIKNIQQEVDQLMKMLNNHPNVLLKVEKGSGVYC